MEGAIKITIKCEILLTSETALNSCCPCANEQLAPKEQEPDYS